MRTREDYYDPAVETMDPENLQALQARLFRRICLHAYRNSRFYRELWSAQGIRPRDLRMGRASRLPFTSKQDLVDSFPFGLCGVPRDELIRVHLTSGSSGIPAASLQSKGDLENTVRIQTRSLFMRGARGGDVLQVTLAYGLWSAGLSLHLAGERLGCMVIPSGPGNTRRQIWLMRTMGTTVLGAVPSYMLRIAEVGEEMGLDFSSLPLRIGLAIGGRLGPGMRDQIESRLGLDLRNVYGMTEAGGVASECGSHQGLHSWQDNLFLEIVDPATGDQLGPGERGELVLTHLRRRGMPLIRYRTGDMTSILLDRECPCGRTHLRISGEIDRADDAVKVKGVLLSPSAIERHLGAFPQLSGEFLIRVGPDSGERPELYCELRSSVESTLAEELAGSITMEIRDRIGLSLLVKTVPPGCLPSERPGKRIQIITGL